MRAGSRRSAAMRPERTLDHEASHTEASHTRHSITQVDLFSRHWGLFSGGQTAEVMLTDQASDAQLTIT